jgi:hypothetical protein
MAKIVKKINSERGWCLNYAVACPDHKRPSVDRNSETSDTEYGIYKHAMGVLFDHGILGEEGEGDHGLTGADLKHWKNWDSTEEVRHTLESAKALVKMANDGKFADAIFSDGYMDEPSIEFDIYPTKGTFMLAYVEDGVAQLEWAFEEEDILEAIASAPSDFTWKWVSQDGEVKINEDDEDDDDEMEEEEEKEE